MDYELVVEQLLLQVRHEFPFLMCVGISCSAPTLRAALLKKVSDLFSGPILDISPFIKMDIKCATANPSEVGPDLIAAAQAAYTKYGGNIVVVSLGTATTLTYIDSEASLSGVVICPGIGILLQAIKRRVPHLPRIPFEFPKSILGKDTTTCLSSGIFWGHLCMISGLIEKIRNQIPTGFKVVMCGGHLSVLREHAGFVDFFEQELVMHGVRILCEKNVLPLEDF